MSITNPYIIWFLSSFFYAYQYVIRVVTAISTTEIIQKFDVDASQFGYLCGIYYIGYTSMSIPLGIIIDKYSLKKVLPCTVLMTALGALPLVLSDQWYLVLAGRFLSGIGSVGAILGVFKVIATYFPQEESGKMLGIAVTIGLLGAIYGGQPVVVIMDNFGWYDTIIGLCSFGLILAALMFVIIPATARTNDKENVIENIKEILSNKMILLLSIAGGFMVGPLEGFADGWSVIIFYTVHEWSKIQASIAPSMIFIGMAIGCSLIGYITSKTQKYYCVILASAVMMILCFMVILYGNYENTSSMGKYIVYSMLILIGIFSAYQIPLLSKVGMIASAKLVAMTTAIANMIIMVFGSVFHTAIGYTVDHYNTHEVRVLYTPEAIIYGMHPILIGLVIALPIVYAVKKMEKQQQ